MGKDADDAGRGHCAELIHEPLARGGPGARLDALSPPVLASPFGGDTRLELPGLTWRCFKRLGVRLD